MKNMEVKIMYFLLGFLAGGLLLTAKPIVQHWPELETRLDID